MVNIRKTPLYVFVIEIFNSCILPDSVIKARNWGEC